VAQAQRKKGTGKSAGGSNTTYIILAVVAVVAVAAVVFSMRGGSLGGNTATAPIELGEISDRELLALAQGVESGDPDAAIWVLEFADFQCPGCQAWSQQVKPLLELNYISTGLVRFVYHDFPLPFHPHAFLASRAGRCANELGNFWAFHDELYRNQMQWSGQANPAGSFIDYAQNVGLDSRAFSSCLRSDRYADVVTANQRLGVALGVPGTPSVMIRMGSGIARRLPSTDYATVAGAIEEALQAMGGGADAADSAATPGN
jgi:protein-disulfide isomerase